MTDIAAARPDNNSLGKAAFVVGLVGLVFSFIPLVGFVSWLLGPLALGFGAVALRRPPRALSIAGMIAGAITLLVCFSWLNATKSVGEALNKNAFNPTGKAAVVSPAQAPIMDASIKGLWKEMEANKIAAGSKYGGHRLRFTNEAIEDFEGDAADPRLQFEGPTEGYITHLVSASFVSTDGAKIGALKKGDKVTFICESAAETLGDGYGLSGCRLG